MCSCLQLPRNKRVAKQFSMRLPQKPCGTVKVELVRNRGETLGIGIAGESFLCNLNTETSNAIERSRS